MSASTIINKRAPGVPFYTPLQSPPAGTARGSPKTLLFTPIKIRGVEFPNRVWVSPMQQYSAENGCMGPWHTAYLGGIIIRGEFCFSESSDRRLNDECATIGPGLTFVEGSAVTSEGRISPEDVGLWGDFQIESHRQVVQFAHSQGKKIGIQLMHSGRKGSCVALWLSFSATATPAAGGWADKIVAPSAVPFEQGYPVPHALSIKEIEEMVVAFKEAARRAVIAGYDVINIHAAHGYLLSEFLSPVANKRTDKYGGSFENRIRFVLEVIDAVRAVIPDTMPVVLRVNATDCLEQEKFPSWTVPQTIELAKIVSQHGVDVLDVSSGGQSAAQTINVFNIQSVYAKQIKDVVGDSLLVGCLGGITSGKVAEQYLQEKRGDMAFVGRHFLEKPGAAWEFAEELDESVHMSKQIEWPFIGRGKRT